MPQRDEQADAGPPVRVSVVIPVYNAAADLERCLSALYRLDPSPWREEVEIIVVDDASTDGSRQVAQQYGARLISLPENGGPARARNHGAAAARGELMVSGDAVNIAARLQQNAKPGEVLAAILLLQGDQHVEQVTVLASDLATDVPLVDDRLHEVHQLEPRGVTDLEGLDAGKS